MTDPIKHAEFSPAQLQDLYKGGHITKEEMETGGKDSSSSIFKFEDMTDGKNVSGDGTVLTSGAAKLDENIKGGLFKQTSYEDFKKQLGIE